jgi:hypothetical protein
MSSGLRPAHQALDEHLVLLEPDLGADAVDRGARSRPRRRGGHLAAAGGCHHRDELTEPVGQVGELSADRVPLGYARRPLWRGVPAAVPQICAGQFFVVGLRLGVVRRGR